MPKNENNFENTYNDNNENQFNINDIKNDDIKLYEEIIENNLLKLLGNNILKDISNQDLLATVFEIYKDEYGWKKEILVDDLIRMKEKSVLKNIQVEYANKLLDYNMAYNYSDSLYELDSNTQKYVYQEIGHEKNNISIIHKELINKSIKNYAFVKTTSNSIKTTSGYHYLYYSYDNDTLILKDYYRENPSK